MAFLRAQGPEGEGEGAKGGHKEYGGNEGQLTVTSLALLLAF